MTDLGPEARSILGAGKSGDDPTPADRARVRGKLARAIAAGGVLGAASAAGTASEGTAAAATALAGKTATLLALGKIGGGIVFVVALGAGIWFSRPLPPGSPPPPATSVAVADTALPASPSAIAPSAAADTASPTSPSAEPLAAARPAVEPSDSPAAPSSAGVRPSGTTVASPKVADTDPPKDPLEDETRQLREAHGALQSGDPGKALKLLDEQATTYASGQLREERAAARVLALCKLGKVDEARAKAAEFLRDNPQSPLADRVRAGCPTPSP